MLVFGAQFILTEIQTMRFQSAALALFAVVFTAQSQAQTFSFSPEQDPHNFLMLQVPHQVFSTSIGFFRTFEGTIQLDQANLENSTVEVVIDLDSIDFAGHEEWNTNAKNAMFKLPEFPQMTYKSVSVEDLGDGKMKVNGELTLLGVTQPVVLDAQLNAIADYFGTPKAGFSATTELTRADFGITAMGGGKQPIPVTIEIEALLVED